MSAHSSHGSARSENVQFNSLRRRPEFLYEPVTSLHELVIIVVGSGDATRKVIGEMFSQSSMLRSFEGTK